MTRSRESDHKSLRPMQAYRQKEEGQEEGNVKGNVWKIWTKKVPRSWSAPLSLICYKVLVAARFIVFVVLNLPFDLNSTFSFRVLNFIIDHCDCYYVSMHTNPVSIAHCRAFVAIFFMYTREF